MCGFARLMGRAFAEPREEVQAVVMEEFGEIIDAFPPPSGSPAAPDRGRADLALPLPGRSHGHTVSCGNLLEQYSGGLCQAAIPTRPSATCPFLSAGLRAGLPRPRARSRAN